jgi:PTS system glucose-specific IIC component
MNIVNAHIGMTFSGGLIDFIVYGVLPDVSSHGANCYMVPIIGGVLAPIYYLLFRNLILHFDIKTPGRDSEVRMFTKADYKEKINATTTPIQSSESKVDALALAVIKAYGGRENIRNVDACITKLRVQVVNPDIVNKDELVRLGARGVMKPSPQSVYAVFGVEADSIKNNMNDILRKG